MIKLLRQKLSKIMSDCIKIVNLIKAKALNLRIFFNTMRRNGIRTSIIAILHFCASALTRKNSRKTIGASEQNKAVFIKIEQAQIV